MTTGTAHEIQGTSLVIRPNRSLPVAGIVLLFTGATAWALVVGVGFALAGASMIAPFAVLETLLVALLCRWIYRHLDDCELITIGSDRVRIMKRRGTAMVCHEFPRAWARVRFDPAVGSAGRARLLLGSHGKFITLADDVADGDRAELARELQRLLRAPPAAFEPPPGRDGPVAG